MTPRFAVASPRREQNNPTVESHDYHKAPPRMYVDNETVICEVTNLTTLRAGEHLLCPLNMLRGLGFPLVDYVVDTMCQWGNFHAYHHFVMMDDVAGVAPDGRALRIDGEEAEVGEYTNTAPEFREKASKVGFCGAFMDKASFKISKLSNYKGAVFYRVVEQMQPEHLRKVLENARKAASEGKVFTNYNMISRNCEHAISELKGRGRYSPQIQFVAWNSFRAILQLLGLACLWYIDHSHLWFYAAIGYYSLAVIPPVLQSIIIFIKAAIQILRLRRNKILNWRKFCHLMSQEACRVIFVGGGAGFVIGILPRAIWEREEWRKRDRFGLACVALLSFISANTLYNFLAHIAVKLIIYCRGSPSYFSPRASGANSPWKKPKRS